MIYYHTQNIISNETAINVILAIHNHFGQKLK